MLTKPIYSGPLTLRCPCSAAVRPSPLHCAVLFRSRSSHYFLVVALATMLLAHVSAFAGMLLTLGPRPSGPPKVGSKRLLPF
jgi:hypothetical protein